MDWDDWHNAEIYDRFVREPGIYRELNRTIARLAELETARRVLDVACGTGATADACLARMPPDGELVGVDASETVVELARIHCPDPRARFEVAPAGRLADAVDGPFDRAVCNAAFWQFPSSRSALAAIAALLSNGGRWVFNVPSERVVGEPAAVHPFQAALARALESARGTPFPRTATQVDRAVLASQGAEVGLSLDEVVAHTVHTRQAELMELMEIPVMHAPLTEGLDEDARLRALDEARRRCDPELAVEVRWLFFVWTRTDSDPENAR